MKLLIMFLYGGKNFFKYHSTLSVEAASWCNVLKQSLLQHELAWSMNYLWDFLLHRNLYPYKSQTRYGLIKGAIGHREGFISN